MELLTSANAQSQPVNGKIRIISTVPILYDIGPNPKIVPGRSAQLPVGVIMQLTVSEGTFLAFAQIDRPGSLHVDTL